MKPLKNQLLALLKPESLDRLSDDLDHVELRQGQAIHERMQDITHVYFITSGFSSEIAIDQGGRSAVWAAKVSLEFRRYWAFIDHLNGPLWKPTVRHSAFGQKTCWRQHGPTNR